MIYVVLPLTLLRLKQLEMYQEMFIGLLFILILSDSHEDRLSFAKNVKIIYVLILSIYLLFDRKSFSPYNTFYKIFAPFFFISFICIFFSETIAVCLQKTVSYFFMFLIIPNYVTKLYNERGIVFFRDLIFFGALMLLIGFAFLFVLDDENIGRFKGVFGNPNGLGLFCFLFFALHYTLNKTFENFCSTRENQIVYTLIILSIVMSSSRNSLLSVFILMLFPFFFRKSFFLGITSTIVFVFMGSILLAEIPFIINAMGLGSYFRLNTADELSGRTIAWTFAWKQIQYNFFIGKGFVYDEYIMAKNFRMLEALGHQGGVHNSFLSLWLDFGLVGVLLYCRSFFLTFIRASRINKLAFPVMYAVLFSATFEGLFIGSLNPQMIILLIIITILLNPDFGNVKEEEKLEGALIA